jgi:retron-type reverse transcriptase
MKRTGQIIESIVTADNMRLAFLKAVKGQRLKNSVIEYEKNLNDNLTSLAEKLRTATQKWGPYFCFKIFDPKEREIKVAPIEDRIAHHALLNICEPSFEQYQIFDSYACRKNKGQFATLERAKTFCRHNQWYLKLDIRKYFDSIAHDVLKKQLSRRFKDVYVLKNFYDIIDSYKSKPYFGVPIGSLTSQFFANHYLAVMDRFIKEELKSNCYVRYMDDFILWNNNAAKLKHNFVALQNFLTNELRLSMKPRCLNRCQQGITFLGFRIFHDRMTLSHRSRYRFRRKLQTMTDKFERGEWNEYTYATHLETLFAFVRHAKTQNFRQRVMQEVGIDPLRLVPRESRRELEQQREELPVGESEQQHADESE